jgi:hypothetical protein
MSDNEPEGDLPVHRDLGGASGADPVGEVTQYPDERKGTACHILTRLYAKQLEARRCQKMDAVSCYDLLIARFRDVFPDAADKAGAPPPPRHFRTNATRPHDPHSRVSTTGMREGGAA